MAQRPATSCAAFQRSCCGYPDRAGQRLFEPVVIPRCVCTAVLDRPLLLLGLASILAAGLHTLAAEGASSRVSPAEIEGWEGATVIVEGVVAAFHPAGDDAVRLLIADGPDAVWVYLRGGPVAARGSWAEIEGRVWRRGVELEVSAAASGHHYFGPPPAPLDPGWPQVATEPGQWGGRPIRLAGLVEGNRLTDGGGRSIGLGAGPWPEGGPVVAMGALRYAPSCLCHQFDAAVVDVPWKPTLS